MYEQTVLGYERDGEAPIGPGTYLMICPNNASVLAAVEPLADWRRRQGYNVMVVTTAETGGTNSQIRSYLQGQYNTLEIPLEFVCLVGDANGSVAVPTFRENHSGYNGEGDHDYTRLDGGDPLSDVHLGRLSVSTVASLQTVVDKIISYETDPYFDSDVDWFLRAGLAGDPNSSSGYSTIWVNQWVKHQLLELGYTQVDTIWSGNFTTQMLATVNQGESIFTYRGYWGMSGMNSGHISGMYNGEKLPFAVIMTCDTGSFLSDSNCRSEAFLRASNGGGVAAIGTATLGTHTRYNNCMFQGVLEGCLNSGDTRTGPALTRGKLNMYQNYQLVEPDEVLIWSTWNNLMGDPATPIYTGVPVDLNVDYPAQISLGTNAVPVTVFADGAPVVGALVGIYKAGEVQASAFTDESGQVMLPVSGASAGELQVTVTAAAQQWYQRRCRCHGDRELRPTLADHRAGGAKLWVHRGGRCRLGPGKLCAESGQRRSGRPGSASAPGGERRR